MPTQKFSYLSNNIGCYRRPKNWRAPDLAERGELAPSCGPLSAADVLLSLGPYNDFVRKHQCVPQGPAFAAEPPFRFKFASPPFAGLRTAIEIAASCTARNYFAGRDRYADWDGSNKACAQRLRRHPYYRVCLEQSLACEAERCAYPMCFCDSSDLEDIPEDVESQAASLHPLERELHRQGIRHSH